MIRKYESNLNRKGARCLKKHGLLCLDIFSVCNQISRLVVSEVEFLTINVIFALAFLWLNSALTESHPWDLLLGLYNIFLSSGTAFLACETYRVSTCILLVSSQAPCGDRLCAQNSVMDASSSFSADIHSLHASLLPSLDTVHFHKPQNSPEHQIRSRITERSCWDAASLTGLLH